MDYKRWGYFVLSVILLSSCTKNEGEGGKAKITGVITEKFFTTDFQYELETIPASGKTVYITYGDQEKIGDDTETNFDGSYSFSYLQPGRYTIMVYSDDSTGVYPYGDKPIIKEIEISDTKETVDAGDITILNTKDYTDGIGYITGKVYSVIYDNTYTTIYDEYFAMDKWVYICYEDNPAYFDRLRTSYDGSFRFDKLIQGNYTVYVYSEDSTMTAPEWKIAKKATAIITENHLHDDVGTIRILD